MTKTIIAVTACYMYFWCLNSSTYTIYNLREIPVSADDFCVYSLGYCITFCPPANVSVYFILVDGESKKFEFVLTGRLPVSGDIVLPGVYVTCILTVLMLRDRTIT